MVAPTPVSPTVASANYGGPGRPVDVEPTQILRTARCASNDDKEAFIAAPSGLPVREAARLMKEHNLGAVLVIEDDRLVGICTERDIVFEVVVAGLDP